jgi:hypothetical protein
METFVVRVWVPRPDDEAHEPRSVRGLVEHVRTGRSDPFVGPEELVELIASPITRTEQGEVP